MTTVDELVRQGNQAIERENEQLRAAEEDARARIAAGPPMAMPSQPSWLEAAAKLAGSPPAHLAAAAERAEQEAARIDAQRRRQRIEECLSVLPALYSCELGSPLLPKFVRRVEAIEETREAASSGAPGMVWVGNTKAGKSTLACAAARGWAHARGPGRIVFRRASELATASRYHPLGSGQPKILTEAIGADLLILDELGEPPQVAQWTDLEDVVFARYEQNRPTWVTTWLRLDEPTGRGVATDTAHIVTQHYGSGFARRILERASVIDCGLQ